MHIDKIKNLVHKLIIRFIDGCLILVDDYKIKTIFTSFILILTIILITKMIMDFIHRGY